jgi:hypothetical protein
MVERYKRKHEFYGGQNSVIVSSRHVLDVILVMLKNERKLIELCKKQIEQKFSFGNGQGYTQRHLEMLSAQIANKTGMLISLSTLKRLWKDNHKQSPQLATLNALAMIQGLARF